MADDNTRLGGSDGPAGAAGAADGLRGGDSQLGAARALHRFAARLASEQDQDTLHSAIVEAAMEIAGADGGGLQIFDPVRNGLKLVKWENLHPASVEVWRWIGADSETGRVLSNDARIVVTDIEAGLSPRDGAIHEFRRNGLRATQSTPLRSRSGQLLGILSTHWRRPLPAAGPDFTLFDVLARLAADVIERAGAEQRQKLLTAELQHRVRNILAIVRSMVQRSAQTSDTLEDLSMHLEGRIDSMARTQVILARNLGAGVDIEDIVREELLSQAAGESQVSIDGPEVRLPARAAEVLNLAVHELATNSIKYGALAAPDGRVAIAWTLDGRDGQSWLRFAWIESGVRVVAAAPRREGFGAELLTGRVPYELGGKGSFDLKPGGIHCIVEFPLVNRESILDADLRGPGRERRS